MTQAVSYMAYQNVHDQTEYMGEGVRVCRVPVSIIPLTVLNLQEVLNQILHQPILLRHVLLEVDHFLEDILIVLLQIVNMGGHLLLRSR